MEYHVFDSEIPPLSSRYLRISLRGGLMDDHKHDDENSYTERLDEYFQTQVRTLECLRKLPGAEGSHIHMVFYHCFFEKFKYFTPLLAPLLFALGKQGKYVGLTRQEECFRIAPFCCPARMLEFDMKMQKTLPCKEDFTCLMDSVLEELVGSLVSATSFVSEGHCQSFVALLTSLHDDLTQPSFPPSL
ncbi:hypothetical protein DPSP01_006227 [Paraphaeosphaeria sporulosa]